MRTLGKSVKIILGKSVRKSVRYSINNSPYSVREIMTSYHPNSAWVTIRYTINMLMIWEIEL